MIKGVALDSFIVGAFLVNLAVDLLQFDQVSSIVAVLRAGFFYSLFLYHFLRMGLRKSDLILFVLLLYTVVSVLMSSDVAHSFRFLLRVFVPFFLMTLAYRTKTPLLIVNRLRKLLPKILVVFILYTIASNVFRFGVETYGSSVFMTGYLFGADLHFIALAILVTFTTGSYVNGKMQNRKLWETVVCVVSFVILMLTLRRTSMFIVLTGIGFMSIVSVRHLVSRLVPIVVGFGIIAFLVVNSSLFMERFEARADKFSVESLEEEARYMEVDVILNEVLYFENLTRSFFGHELFNSVDNYADGRFKGRMIHVDYFTWLHGGGVIGLLLYLVYLGVIPRTFKMPFFTKDMTNSWLRLFWFLFVIQFVISVSGQMYIISFRSFIFIYLALMARTYHLTNGIKNSVREPGKQVTSASPVRTGAI
ncbi:MAG TPA: hypothetical protein DCR04_00825 [Flavobacteriales bacterium]|nr:hypothetical protein [Flavobacteriales bacterium]